MKNCNGGAGNLSKVPGVDLLGRVWKGGGGVGGPFKQSVSQLPLANNAQTPLSGL